jgi:voltage-gated potassium channel
MARVRLTRSPPSKRGWPRWRPPLEAMDAPVSAESPRAGLRNWVHLTLDASHAAGAAGATVEAGLIALIAANTIAVTVESVPAYRARFGGYFDAFEIVSLIIFTVEYLARLWAAPEDPRFTRSAIPGRLRYAVQPLMIIDFFAIAPSIVALFVPFVDLRILRLFRLLRLLKIARYSPALTTFANVIAAERRALVGTLVLLLCVMSFAAEAMHFIEGEVQPALFGTLPDSMWWAITTLTTVGYGDAVPVTALGKFAAAITMIIGLGLYALPIGIVATGFINEIHRRDFVVTWSMLSRMPLFRDLDVNTMGDILNALHSQSVAAEVPIAHAGETPRAMYFIVSGEAESHHPELGSKRLGPGDFFGEAELLRHEPHKSSVKARTHARLLVLPAEEFNTLLRMHPKLRERVEMHAARAHPKS